MSERNSSGERLYKDSGGAKCNIRGMIRREPEWVASRFNVMEDEIATLTAERDELLKHNRGMLENGGYDHMAMQIKDERSEAARHRNATTLLINERNTLTADLAEMTSERDRFREVVAAAFPIVAVYANEYMANHELDSYHPTHNKILWDMTMGDESLAERAGLTNPAAIRMETKRT